MKNLKYNIIVSSKRKTVSVTIYPDARVVIRVPKRLPQEKIDDIVKSKEDWIIKKIQYFEENKLQEVKEKEYVNGEIFYFLGKRYELKILNGTKNDVQIIDDVILVKIRQGSVKNVLLKWFTVQARNVFSERLLYCFELFSRKYSYQFPTLKIRKMKARWGSMSSKGGMVLNAFLIHSSIECIDYVITHELCHLKHRNHSKQFYKTQEEFVQNWKELKKKLESFNCEIKSL